MIIKNPRMGLLDFGPYPVIRLLTLLSLKSGRQRPPRLLHKLIRQFDFPIEGILKKNRARPLRGLAVVLKRIKDVLDWCEATQDPDADSFIEGWRESITWLEDNLDSLKSAGCWVDYQWDSDTNARRTLRGYYESNPIYAVLWSGETEVAGYRHRLTGVIAAGVMNAWLTQKNSHSRSLLIEFTRALRALAESSGHEILFKMGERWQTSVGYVDALKNIEAALGDANGASVDICRTLRAGFNVAHRKKSKRKKRGPGGGGNGAGGSAIRGVPPGMHGTISAHGAIESVRTEDGRHILAQECDVDNGESPEQDRCPDGFLRIWFPPTPNHLLLHPDLFQRHLAAACSSIIRRNQYLLFTRESLPDAHCELLFEAFHERFTGNDDQRTSAALAALSLTCGLNVSQLESMYFGPLGTSSERCIVISTEKPLIQFVDTISARPGRRNIDPAHYEEVDEVYALPIPPTVWTALLASEEILKSKPKRVQYWQPFESNGHLLDRMIDSALSAAFDSTGIKATAAQIADALPRHAYAITGEAFISSMCCGRKIPPLSSQHHYSRITGNNIADVRHAVWQLWNMDVQDHKPVLAIGSGYLGSSAVPTTDSIRETVRALRNQVRRCLRQGRIIINEAHNYVAVYTVLGIDLSTGSRATDSKYHFESEFNYGAATLPLQDKDGSEFVNTRLGVLSSKCLDQVIDYRSWRDYVFGFCTELPVHDSLDAISPAHEKRLASNRGTRRGLQHKRIGCFFELRNAAARRRFSNHFYRKVLAGVGLSDTQGFRRFYRTYLIDAGCSPTAVDYFMSHSRRGASCQSRHSTFSFKRAEPEIRAAIDRLFRDIDYHPIKQILKR